MLLVLCPIGLSARPVIQGRIFQRLSYGESMAVPGLDPSDQFIHSVVVFSGHWIALSSAYGRGVFRGARRPPPQSLINQEIFALFK